MAPHDRIYVKLARLAAADFADVLEGSKIVVGKLRLFVTDDSFVDVWLSAKKKAVCAYHRERKDVDGRIFRYNNLPDKDARKLKSFPKHFHNGTERNITENDLSDDPEEALRTVLEFVRKTIRQ